MLRLMLTLPSEGSKMTLEMWSKIYRYNPNYHKIGDNVVAFPCSTPTEEWGFWNLSDYFVSSVSGGTIWLLKRELK